MDLDLLRTFLAVYRAGSLTGAAPSLGLSQPTVTAQVRALEEQLGQQLFVRRARGVTPTSVADELAARIAPHVDALSDVALGPADAFAAPVHLAGPAELTTMRVLPALTGLVASGLRLRVTFGLAEDLLAGLAQRRFDVVVSTIRPRGRGLTATPLTDEEFVLVGPRGFDGDPRTAPLVAYAEDLPIIRRYWRSVLGVRPPSGPAVVVPDLRGVLTCVLTGFGVSVLPRYLCAAELASGDLVALLEPAEPPINTLFVVTRAEPCRPGPAAVRDALLADADRW
ncbi:LysR family transcriptional regulator [Amycolatopsis australiensis]|uniref:DNA-binding transcriptional regulator, LysR family n=1 Tax=Amycolatopsis australiensis TaxID=546364 RepID=A0A1K1T640_9PSEU|nr:LysR family transcriptional regulator [Amycolatopsis australiensis]SFW91839.1 DNA-binding transcriptional regulator, LysR family [Amycolatopsis australiensis]